MRRSSLFGHTAELLETVISSRQPADAIVQDFYRRRHYLGARDRRIISGLLFGILRQFRFLDSVVRQALSVSLPAVALRKIPPVGFCAAYVLKNEGEPAESLLPDVAGLWRTGTSDVDPGLFLAQLTSALTSPALPEDPAERAALNHSLPAEAVREWFERFGPAEAYALCVSLNEPAPTTIRVNTLRCTIDECRAALAAEGIQTRPAPLSPVGLILEKRVNLGSLASYRNGFFEVQDAGSQLIGLLVAARPDEQMVDACAGAGGKTLHCAAEMDNRGSILALDVEERRLRNLTVRARRAGVTIARTLAAPGGGAPAGLTGPADAVLIDAPCSGIGTYRRNPGAKLMFTSAYSASLQKTQTELLDRYAPLVRPGGRLVYSTCTLLRGENEARVEEFLDHHREFRLASAPAALRERGVAIDDEGPTLLLLPHRTGTDGFFAALFLRAS
jgi:16S rRNA (cytosine967-C5)-methyltransferase